MENKTVYYKVKTREHKSEITVRNQGIKGGDAKIFNVGCTTIYATDRGQTRSDLVIDVDAFVGSGANYERRNKTLINVTFQDNILFAGTIEEFVERLKKK
jgi:hypothetical protein